MLRIGMSQGGRSIDSVDIIANEIMDMPAS